MYRYICITCIGACRLNLEYCAWIGDWLNTCTLGMIAYMQAVDTPVSPPMQHENKCNVIQVTSIPDQVTWPDLSSMIGYNWCSMLFLSRRPLIKPRRLHNMVSVKICSPSQVQLQAACMWKLVKCNSGKDVRWVNYTAVVADRTQLFWAH